MVAPDVAELLAEYDSQLRTRVPDKRPPGVEYEWDGPLLRCSRRLACWLAAKFGTS